MSGSRRPQPTRIDPATRVERDDSGGWSTLCEGDERPHDGWLVWGEGTFAGAPTIDEALATWRRAVRERWA